MSDWKTEPPKAHKKFRVAIVASRFNDSYVQALLDATEKELISCDILKQDIHITRVPGSFELLYASKKIIDSKQYDGIICLGVIIRGETIHFELIAENVAQSIAKLNIKGKIPVIFGVLACENQEQVKSRIHLGAEYARAAIEMMNIL